jgi:hypothetical protein
MFAMIIVENPGGDMKSKYFSLLVIISLGLLSSCKSSLSDNLLAVGEVILTLLTTL